MVQVNVAPRGQTVRTEAGLELVANGLVERLSKILDIVGVLCATYRAREHVGQAQRTSPAMLMRPFCVM
jgi:hypothetical protein